MLKCFFLVNFKIGLWRRKTDKLRSLSIPFKAKSSFSSRDFTLHLIQKRFEQWKNVDNPSDKREENGEFFVEPSLFVTRKETLLFFLYSPKSTLHLSHFYLDKLAIIVLIDCSNL
jgi:hypothetical protein